MQNQLICTACHGPAFVLDAVDFNKSCEEARGKFLNATGAMVYYALCSQCGFCFAPEIAGWKLEEFSKHIYNDAYVLVDPDYVEARPKANAQTLVSMFKGKAHGFRHLDYGGGEGTLSNLLKESGWKSTSYDPFVNKDKVLSQLGKFDLITAFEVFEHVPDPQQLMRDLRTLLAPNGIVLFSTLLSDGHIATDQKLNWWYAAPRNGHISLFSKQSLNMLAHQNKFNFACFSEGFHTFFTKVPRWANHLIAVN
jgi:SAM-dependent methyltransferase